jgi:hypothetical protein
MLEETTRWLEGLALCAFAMLFVWGVVIAVGEVIDYFMEE